MSGALTFDIMTVQVEKAKMYMEQHKHTFSSIGYENSDQSANDLYNNKVIYANYTRIDLPWISELNKNPLGFSTDSLWANKLNKLVEDIKLKKSLFAEIEYMLRNKPIEHTLNCDLELIVQNIMHVRSSPLRKYYKSNVIVMKENSPLATLGFVAQMLCAHNKVIIESTANTAIICHIFTTACHQAGLDNVKLAFVEISQPGANDVTELGEMQTGCVAVVAASADVDSALDAIIGAPDVYPWRVRRVFVQECIGKRLRAGLACRSGLKEDAPSREYVIDGKRFLHECSANPCDGIPIEEYRTVKELLALYKENVPLALSLWCSDVAESNEIAHGVSSNLVWINGLDEFAGPPASSQAFYSILDVTFGGRHMLASKKQCYSENWAKLSTSARRELIQRALYECNIKLDVPELPGGGFATVDGGLLCVGVQTPADFVFWDEGWAVDKVLSALVVGTTIFNVDLQNFPLFQALRSVGAPANALEFQDDCKTLVLPSILSMYRTKVVWTTFGTTFAN